MELKTLGWNSFFEEHFERFRDGKTIPARVFSLGKDICDVFSEDGELPAKISGRIHYDAVSKSDFPAVGDWVVLAFEPDNQFSIIRAVLPRQSCFSRKASGGRKSKSGGVTEEQVIAANIDTVFIVIGLDRDYNLRRIERYLTLVYNSASSPVIVLNKSDLCPEVEGKILEVESVAFGIPIHAISAQRKTGMDSLSGYLTIGKTAALIGSSGVGKSTIINALLGEDRQEVKPLRERIGKGRHTTTRRELMFTPTGGIIMDNPGMRELSLWADEQGLSEVFKDVEELARHCRFGDCRHEREPGCAVKKAIEEGTLDADRYKSYSKLKKELWYLEESRHKTSRQVEKAKWEKILKDNDLTLKQMTRLSKKSKKRFSEL
ncbi:MAG: ribosome small subunit-dependent GTPase A [Candidatus Aminicenantes bacterium]|nr:ribosome small subunit-dependent GTPase A [Candidatus Aminicenantes bacterium]